MENDKHQNLRLRAAVAPLSELIAELLLLGQEASNTQLIKWASLELGGYFEGNTALTSDVVVPEYRIVVGQYFDRYGRPLVITESRFSFINEYRLRDGVRELERMEHSSPMLTVQDPKFTEMIRENLHVEVHHFSFSSTCITGILSGIRARLLGWLAEIGSLSLLKSGVTTNAEPVAPRVRTGILSWLFRRRPNPLDELHPTVVSTASRLYCDGHYRQAILDTYIALVQRVRDISGRSDLDNTPLMQTVFSPKSPIVVLSDDADQQMGYMWMFSGAVMGVRNPKAHRLEALEDPQHAAEWLAFASVLFRLLDKAKVPHKS